MRSLTDRIVFEAGLTFGADTGGPIVIDGTALPWNTTVRMNWWGDTVEFAPGSVAPPAPARVKFLLDHAAHAMGYGVAFEQRADGLGATVVIPRDELADVDTARAVRQMRNGIRDGLSVGVAIDEADESDGPSRFTKHYRVTAGTLLELSSVIVPRFDDARIGRIAAAADDDPDPDEPEPDDEPEPEPAAPEPAAPEPDTEETTDMSALDEIERRARHRATPAPAPARAARFASFGAYALARYQGAIDESYERIVQAALVDETTTDIAGIVPEQWMRDLVDLMGTVTPIVQAFSQRPLPTAGMVVNEPRVDQDPDVGQQAAQKTEISTRKVLISSVPFPVLTYAGGQDISIQALMRSDPSYFDELMRLFAREMAINVDKDAAAALVAGTPNKTHLDGADLNASFVNAAAAVLTRTSQLPSVTVLGVDVWVAMGVAKGTDGRPLFPGISPVNPIGSFSLDSTTGQVRGLGYYVDPWLDPALAVVGIPDAFRTRLGPVGTLSADVPSVLGRDVAVYRFATMGVTDARGLQILDPAAAGTTTAAASKKA